MGWRIYRPNDGILVRRIAVIAFLLLTGFACFRWFLWMQDTIWPFVPGNAPPWDQPPWNLHWGTVGAAALGLGGLLIGFRICFVSPKVSTFLIETEVELRKVSWPEYKPWFSSQAEVWGSTYVVVAVLLLMAVLLFSIDSGFRVIQEFLFLGK